MRILIDGDILLFKAAVAGRKWDFGGGVITTSSIRDVRSRLDFAIDNIVGNISGGGPEDVYLCLSSSTHWRKQILPSYKANRGPKPVMYPDVREYAVAKYNCVEWEGLEADDTMGILQTAAEPHTSVIVSDDKDMMTIPGFLYRPKRNEKMNVKADEAFWHHMYQTLVGDSTDNYKGCPGIGPKRAAAIIGDVPTWENIDEEWRVDTWTKVITAFSDRSKTSDEALLQARVSFILHFGHYDPTKLRVFLWDPPISAAEHSSDSGTRRALEKITLPT